MQPKNSLNISETISDNYFIPILQTWKPKTENLSGNSLKDLPKKFL